MTCLLVALLSVTLPVSTTRAGPNPRSDRCTVCELLPSLVTVTFQLRDRPGLATALSWLVLVTSAAPVRWPPLTDSASWTAL